MPRPILAVVSVQNLHHNLQYLSQKSSATLAGKSELMAVVKANAYGHGIERVYPVLQSADSLALLDLSEAKKLRHLGWRKPILLLEGAFQDQDFKEIAQLKLDFTLHHFWQFQSLQEHLHKGLDFSHSRVFVKLNTGMNRLGFLTDDAISTMINVLQQCMSKHFAGAVLMTHFANADGFSGRGPSPQHQADCFMAVSSAIKRQAALMGITSEFKSSLNNSPAVFLDRLPIEQIHRVGVAMYGALNGPANAQQVGLLPVMQLSSEIITTQHLQPGDCVGYGSRFQADKPMRIGVVACGYADGYPRQAPDGTPVLIRTASGQMIRTQLIGRVSMDMLTIDITAIAEAQVGTQVVLFGHSQLTADEVASHCGTIAYELFTAVTARVPFVVGT